MMVTLCPSKHTLSSATSVLAISRKRFVLPSSTVKLACEQPGFEGEASGCCRDLPARDLGLHTLDAMEYAGMCGLTVSFGGVKNDTATEAQGDATSCGCLCGDFSITKLEVVSEMQDAWRS